MVLKSIALALLLTWIGPGVQERHYPHAELIEVNHQPAYTQLIVYDWHKHEQRWVIQSAIRYTESDLVGQRFHLRDSDGHWRNIRFETIIETETLFDPNVVDIQKNGGWGRRNVWQ